MQQSIIIADGLPLYTVALNKVWIGPIIIIEKYKYIIYHLIIQCRRERQTCLNFFEHHCMS